MAKQPADETPKKTQLSRKSSQPTMLSPQDADSGPETPPRHPNLSLDDERVTADPADSGVIAATPDSDVVEAVPASDVVDAQPASDAAPAAPISDVIEVEALDDLMEDQPGSGRRSGKSSSATVTAADDADVFTADSVEEDQVAAALNAPETPVRAEPADEGESETPTADVEEDAIGGEVEMSGVESSIRVRGDRKSDFEATEMFDMSEKSSHPLDETVSLEEPADADSSSVDLGAKPFSMKGSSHSGVDEVAEALESGVIKFSEREAPVRKKKPEPSVEFDDLFTEEVDESAGPKSTPSPEAEKSSDLDVNMDDAAAAMLDDFEPSAAAEEEAPSLWEDGKSETAEEPPPVRPKKKGKQVAPSNDDSIGVAEDDPDARPMRKPTTPTRVPPKPPAPKPKYLRRWVGGAVLGILLAAGGVVGLRYYDPNLLEEGFGYLPDAPKPKSSTPPPPVAPPLSVAQRARAEMDKGDFEAALEALKDAEKTPANLSTRAEARWLKYQKDQADKKAELNRDDAEVKLVIADLDEANNAALKTQVQRTIDYKGLNDTVASLRDFEKATNDLRNLLAKKMLVNDKADASELSKAVSQAITAKEEKEILVQAMEKALLDAKQLSDKDKLDLAAFGKIVKNLTDRQTTLAAVDKLLEDAKVKDMGAKGVEQLLTTKNDLDAKLAAVAKVLADEKIKGEGAKGLQEVLTLKNQLQKDRDELEQAIKAVYQELADGKFVPAEGNPRKDLLAGAKTARSRAESPLAVPLVQLAAVLGKMGLNPAADTKSTFASAAQLAELTYFRMREALIQSPEQRLDVYLAVYQDRNRTDPKDDAAALRDAAWVLSKEAKSSATARAKAQALTGLILRNQQKYAEAKQSLEAAVATTGAGQGAWMAQAKQALQELSDPAAYWLPRVEQLQNAGQAGSAQKELSTALLALPNDARLLVQRGRMRLEDAKNSGKLSAADQKAIRADAAAAQKDAKTTAEGAYLEGLLEEELGNFDAATKLFRQARDSHQGSDDALARYLIALARVLQRDRSTFVAPAPAAPKKEEKKADDTTSDEVSQAFPLALVLVVAAAGGDDGPNPEEEARLKESIDLANKLIQSSNEKIQGEGYMLLGKALAKQGNRTEGVLTFAKGLKLLSPGMAAKEMETLIKEHPAFQQPDSIKPPSAFLAEVHFGKGLHSYWARQYPEAEAHFKQAAGFFSQDARYQYFLGLAQLAQKTKVKSAAANYSFEQGAKLEAANRPPTIEVNAALERVQGDVRRKINSYRLKAIELRD